MKTPFSFPLFVSGAIEPFLLDEDDSPVPAQALEIVARQKGVFTQPPKIVPTRKVPDGPLLGNGDLGVTLGGVTERQVVYGLNEGEDYYLNYRREVDLTRAPERHRFWISKNDFWKAKPIYPNGHPAPIGGIDVCIPAALDGSYYAEQILETAEVIYTLKTKHLMDDPPPCTRAGVTIHMRSWIPATENLLVIELSVDGQETDEMRRPTDVVGVDVTLWPMAGNESETASGNLPDGYWAVRRFKSTTNSVAIEHQPLAWSAEAAVAMRLFNHRQHALPWSRGDGWSSDRFMLSPGRPVTIVAAVVTNFESPSPLEEAQKRVAVISLEQVETLRGQHRQWWREFWSKSFVEIGDPLIEKYYYGSHYLMASCSRNRDFPPSLFGNWITTDSPSWQADYHLNYNHEAPWWGVFSSNQAELADPYDTPILDYMPIARENARRLLQCRGLYYEVGIGPKGLETCFSLDTRPNEGNRLFLGAKGNAAFAAMNMFMRFYHTYDLDYAQLIYPFLVETADLWQDYLKFEDGRYVIYGDAGGEVGDGGTDVNATPTLGFVKALFRGLLDVSRELGRDQQRRAKWQHISDHLSDFPLAQVGEEKLIRRAESGPGAAHYGPGRKQARIEHLGLVWPTGNIGLGSDPEWLKIVQDDVKSWPEHEWTNTFNGFSQTYTTAVRVGHDPHDTLAKLRQQLTITGFPNLSVFGGGGGIENCCGVPATINEMLLQSHEGVLRLFPVWPKEQPARFGRLRACGAFLVSSQLRDGQVRTLCIESEKGRPCTVDNPWPRRRVRVHQKGEEGDREIEVKTEGVQVRFATCPGGIYRLEPA